MKYKNIGDVAEVQTGPFGSQLHKEDYASVGTPIVTVEHLGNRKMTTQNLPRVNDIDKKRLSKYCLLEGDLVFSRVGSVDRCSYVSSEENDWMFSGRCLRVRCDKSKAHPLYLYYYFCLESTKQTIRNIAVGATMPSINTKLLSEIPFCDQAMSTQKVIAETLSCLDDKIELNNRINKNLEAQAQAIFKSWFVDFEPFQGGEFVDSELGKIPKGWRAGILSELVEIKYGKDHKKLADGIIPVYGSGGIMRYADRALCEHESVLVPRKGTLNNVIYINIPFWTVDTMFYTNMKISGAAKMVYFFLKSKDLASMNAGTAVPSMTTDILNNIPMVIAPDTIIRQYDDLQKPFFEQMETLKKQNQTLSKLRDTLLPKLMSGEIQIPQEV